MRLDQNADEAGTSSETDSESVHMMHHIADMWGFGPKLAQALREHAPESSLDDALESTLRAWACGRIASEREGSEDMPNAEQVTAFLGDALTDLTVAAAVLDRRMSTKSKFRLLAADDLQPVLSSYGKA